VVVCLEQSANDLHMVQLVPLPEWYQLTNVVMEKRSLNWCCCNELSTMVDCVSVLENCVTPQTVYVIKAVIALCFVIISLCLMAVLFDIVIFSNRCLKAVQHHAILSILAGMLTCYHLFGKPGNFRDFNIKLSTVMGHS